MNEITPAELNERIKSGNAPKILDVREEHELEIAPLPRDAHIPLGELPARFQELDKESEWVVVCRSGGRSGKATEFLQSEGYKVSNMVGGSLRWADDVDPTLAKY
jgi:rhodanese-related sulfurtransferase